MRGFCLFLFLLSISSCGKGTRFEEETTKELMERSGIFRATLRPLNLQFSKGIQGYSTITIEGNQFYVRVRLENSAKNLMHLQFIHERQPCPDALGDLNQDGVIDFNEVINQSGEILLPLDEELGYQIGSFEFPISNKKGTYTYSRAVSLRQMLKDLQLPDRNESDGMTKLRRGESLNLTGRTLIIYGISDEDDLPPTVVGYRSFSPWMMVPIACGEFFDYLEG